MTTQQNPMWQRISGLCDQAFGLGTTTIENLTDVNQGRGVFSVVQRAELRWHVPGGEQPGPSSVVAKLPVSDANGQAAINTGAYRREALAYRSILPGGPVTAPTCHFIDEPGDGTCSLLLEDLTSRRAVDQLRGLSLADGILVAEELGRLHRHWADHGRLAELNVRRNTIAGLSTDGLRAGLAALESWADHVGPETVAAFTALVKARPRLVDLFDLAPATLCHGDPRADNLVFSDDGRVVLFDWQQLAIQLPEADLAWLTATSLDTDVRGSAERQIVAAGGGDWDRYRLGMALPGLAVLFLAQRRYSNERTKRFVATSLARIGTALVELDVSAIGDGR